MFFTEELKSLQINDIVQESEFSTKYIFNVGEALKPLIARSLSRAFTSCEELDAYPTTQAFIEKELDLVGVAKVEWAYVSLSFRDRLVATTREGSADIGVGIEFYGSDMEEITSITATGEALDSVTGWVSSSKYANSVNLAIRNLGDDLIQKITCKFPSYTHPD